MRISDWSSDVCSADLAADGAHGRAATSRLESDLAAGVEAVLHATGHAGSRPAQRRHRSAATGTSDAAEARCHARAAGLSGRGEAVGRRCPTGRSEEHTSELQSLMRISYAVFCLKKNNTTHPTSVLDS